MSPRTIFEQELELLKDKVAQMGERAELSYNGLMCSVRAGNREVLEKLLANDGQMVDMQRGIEAHCLMMLTRQWPVAGDLRLVSSALKAVTDIERIGDHVTDIAELYLRMGNDREDPYEGLLAGMLKEAGGMLHEAVEAFVEEDGQKAGEVIRQDDVVDNLFNLVKGKMMEAIQQQTLDADRVVDYLMIAKYLEKIGDHAVNIGEWTIFRLTGEMRGVKLY